MVWSAEKGGVESQRGTRMLQQFLAYGKEGPALFVGGASMMSGTFGVMAWVPAEPSWLGEWNRAVDNSHGVTALAVSPDGKTVVTAYRGISIWDVSDMLKPKARK
jgi:hypothetical protein